MATRIVAAIGILGILLGLCIALAHLGTRGWSVRDPDLQPVCLTSLETATLVDTEIIPSGSKYDCPGGTLGKCDKYSTKYTWVYTVTSTDGWTVPRVVGDTFSTGSPTQTTEYNTQAEAQAEAAAKTPPTLDRNPQWYNPNETQPFTLRAFTYDRGVVTEICFGILIVLLSVCVCIWPQNTIHFVYGSPAKQAQDKLAKEIKTLNDARKLQLDNLEKKEQRLQKKI